MLKHVEHAKGFKPWSHRGGLAGSGGLPAGSAVVGVLGGAPHQGLLSQGGRLQGQRRWGTLQRRSSWWLNGWEPSSGTPAGGTRVLLQGWRLRWFTAELSVSPVRQRESARCRMAGDESAGSCLSRRTSHRGFLVNCSWIVGGTMSFIAPFPGMDLSKMDRPTLTLLVAAGCVMLTMHFTVQLVSQHLFYWKNPKEQKAILIIVLMAPLYAITSFVGLLDIQGSETFFTFLEAIKECYEALVIAKFLALMYSYLNISISKNIVPDEIKGRVLHHSFPVSLFLPRTVRLEHKTLKLLKYWTWQFVVIRPVCSVLIIALQLLGMYPSWVSWTFSIILNISVSMALYALVIFYHVFAKELAPHKPLAKFLCVKGIVFFSFWQGFALDILAEVGVIQSHHFWLDVEHIQEAIQNVLIILEMVVFSVIQQYAYHVAPYSGADRAKFEKKNE